jgi:hypothetical protein
MFGIKQRRKLTFVNITAVTKPIKYTLKPLAFANVRKNCSCSSKINSELFF